MTEIKNFITVKGIYYIDRKAFVENMKNVVGVDILDITAYDEMLEFEFTYDTRDEDWGDIYESFTDGIIAYVADAVPKDEHGYSPDWNIESNGRGFIQFNNAVVKFVSDIPEHSKEFVLHSPSMIDPKNIKRGDVIRYGKKYGLVLGKSLFPVANCWEVDGVWGIDPTKVVKKAYNHTDGFKFLWGEISTSEAICPKTTFEGGGRQDVFDKVELIRNIYESQISEYEPEFVLHADSATTPTKHTFDIMQKTKRLLGSIIWEKELTAPDTEWLDTGDTAEFTIPGHYRLRYEIADLEFNEPFTKTRIKDIGRKLSDKIRRYIANQLEIGEVDWRDVMTSRDKFTDVTGYNPIGKKFKGIEVIVNNFTGKSQVAKEFVFGALTDAEMDVIGNRDWIKSNVYVDLNLLKQKIETIGININDIHIQHWEEIDHILPTIEFTFDTDKDFDAHKEKEFKVYFSKFLLPPIVDSWDIDFHENTGYFAFPQNSVLKNMSQVPGYAKEFILHATQPFAGLPNKAEYLRAKILTHIDEVKEVLNLPEPHASDLHTIDIADIYHDGKHYANMFAKSPRLHYDETSLGYLEMLALQRIGVKTDDKIITDFEPFHRGTLITTNKLLRNRFGITMNKMSQAVEGEDIIEALHKLNEYWKYIHIRITSHMPEYTKEFVLHADNVKTYNGRVLNMEYHDDADIDIWWISIEIDNKEQRGFNIPSDKAWANLGDVHKGDYVSIEYDEYNDKIIQINKHETVPSSAKEFILHSANTIEPWRNSYYTEFIDEVPIAWLKKFREYDRRVEPKFGHSDVDDLKADIAKNGVREALMLIIGQENRIACLGEGNTRLAVMEELGYEKAPVRVIRERGGPDCGVHADMPDVPIDGYFPADSKPTNVFADLPDYEIHPYIVKSRERKKRLGYSAKPTANDPFYPVHEIFDTRIVIHPNLLKKYLEEFHHLRVKDIRVYEKAGEDTAARSNVMHQALHVDFEQPDWVGEEEWRSRSYSYIASITDLFKMMGGIIDTNFDFEKGYFDIAFDIGVHQLTLGVAGYEPEFMLHADDYIDETLCACCGEFLGIDPYEIPFEEWEHTGTDEYGQEYYRVDAKSVHYGCGCEWTDTYEMKTQHENEDPEITVVERVITKKRLRVPEYAEEFILHATDDYYITHILDRVNAIRRYITPEIRKFANDHDLEPEFILNCELDIGKSKNGQHWMVRDCHNSPIVGAIINSISERLMDIKSTSISEYIIAGKTINVPDNIGWRTDNFNLAPYNPAMSIGFEALLEYWNHIYDNIASIKRERVPEYAPEFILHSPTEVYADRTSYLNRTFLDSFSDPRELLANHMNIVRELLEEWEKDDIIREEFAEWRNASNDEIYDAMYDIVDISDNEWLDAIIEKLDKKLPRGQYMTWVWPGTEESRIDLYTMNVKKRPSLVPEYAEEFQLHAVDAGDLKFGDVLSSKQDNVTFIFLYVPAGRRVVMGLWGDNRDRQLMIDTFMENEQELSDVISTMTDEADKISGLTAVIGTNLTGMQYDVLEEYDIIDSLIEMIPEYTPEFVLHADDDDFEIEKVKFLHQGKWIESEDWYEKFYDNDSEEMVYNLSVDPQYQPSSVKGLLDGKWIFGDIGFDEQTEGGWLNYYVTFPVNTPEKIPEYAEEFVLHANNTVSNVRINNSIEIDNWWVVEEDEYSVPWPIDIRMYVPDDYTVDSVQIFIDNKWVDADNFNFGFKVQDKSSNYYYAEYDTKLDREKIPEYTEEFQLHADGKWIESNKDFWIMCNKVKGKLERKGDKVIGDCKPIPVTNPPDTLYGVEPLMPAYGRDYRHLIDVQMALLEGKDFWTPGRGAAGIGELSGMVSKIRVRYNKLQDTGYVYIMELPEVEARIKSHEKRFKLSAPSSAKDCEAPSCFTGYEIMYPGARVRVKEGEHIGKIGKVVTYDVEPPTAEVTIGPDTVILDIENLRLLGEMDIKTRRDGNVYFAFESENNPKYPDFTIVILDPISDAKEIHDVTHNDTWGTFVWIISKNKKNAKEDFWDAYDNYKLWENLGYRPKPAIPEFAPEFVLHSPTPGSRLKEMMSEEGYFWDSPSNSFKHYGLAGPHKYDMPSSKLIKYMSQIGFIYDEKWGVFSFAIVPEKVPDYTKEFVLHAPTPPDIQRWKDKIIEVGKEIEDMLPRDKWFEYFGYYDDESEWGVWSSIRWYLGKGFRDKAEHCKIARYDTEYEDLCSRPWLYGAYIESACLEIGGHRKKIDYMIGQRGHNLKDLLERGTGISGAPEIGIDEEYRLKMGMTINWGAESQATRRRIPGGGWYNDDIDSLKTLYEYWTSLRDMVKYHEKLPTFAEEFVLSADNKAVDVKKMRYRVNGDWKTPDKWGYYYYDNRINMDIFSMVVPLDLLDVDRVEGYIGGRWVEGQYSADYEGEHYLFTVYFPVLSDIPKSSKNFRL